MRLRNHARRGAATRSLGTTTPRVPHAPRRSDVKPTARESTASGQRSHVTRSDRLTRLRNGSCPGEEDPDGSATDRGRAVESSLVVDRDDPPTGRSDGSTTGVTASYVCLLQSAFAPEDRLDATSWLTSPLIDLMLWRLAAQYADVHFLATDFCHLHLPSLAKARAFGSSQRCDIRDVLGRRVDATTERPIVFVANVGRIHWNLLRVQFHPHAELQLFEPMGRPSSRSGISYRSVPRCVIEWLDAWYPQDTSWLARSVSAITRPQQVSGFDCGVACLLYADKCGQGQPREAINESTDQHEITTFRSELQRQLQSELLPHA